MPSVRLAILALALCSSLAAGCGGNDGGGDGGDDKTAVEVPGGASPGRVQVIRDWSDALRGGDVEKAATYFDVPSVVQNGTPPLRLIDRDDVIAFNRALPCGAELVRAEDEGRYTVATFELTERPGAGECGEGTGGTASTAFAIRDGLITEWRRVPTPEEAAPPAEGPIV